LSGAQGRGN